MRFSVVIPALNEAENIAACIASAKGAQVIVTDGGSGDATIDIARNHGADIIVGTGGRGAQQNAGAGHADGNALLFLHADTVLPTGWRAAAERLLARPEVAVGAFSLSIRDARNREAIIAGGANLRSRLLSLPYGDQALFLRRETFDRLGGFNPLPVMEDFDLVHRARKLGEVKTLPQTVTTSNRRWRRVGALRTLLINQAMLAGWAMDVPPERLARFYGRVR
ncbi:MAG: TIGR04283 family arsenosugar biosynthesis glycosyltransferase [Pacificimonas sp.]